MSLTRRTLFGSVLAAPALLGAAGAKAAARTFRISHQFPGGTTEGGDFRDRLVRRFADEVQRRTGGDLAFEVHPDASLMKPTAQFSALRRGTLDMTLYSIAYSSDEMPEASIGQMPCLVTTYEQGMAWKAQPIGQELVSVLDKRGMRIVTWIWQAGSMVSHTPPLLRPEDFHGVRTRGGSREMDLMLNAAGGISISIPPNELHAAMQAGLLDAAVTSSTSLISFKMQDVAKSVTVGGAGSFWFTFSPLLMSNKTFDALPERQQRVIMEVGTEMEAFGMDAAKDDDDGLRRVFTQAGLEVRDMDESAIDTWRLLAEATAWKDFARRSTDCAGLLKLAQAVA